MFDLGAELTNHTFNQATEAHQNENRTLSGKRLIHLAHGSPAKPDGACPHSKLVHLKGTSLFINQGFRILHEDLPLLLIPRIHMCVCVCM